MCPKLEIPDGAQMLFHFASDASPANVQLHYLLKIIIEIYIIKTQQKIIKYRTDSHSMQFLFFDQIPDHGASLCRSGNDLRITGQDAALNLEIGCVMAFVLGEQFARTIVDQSQNVIGTGCHRALAILGQSHVHDRGPNFVGGQRSGP